MECVCRPERAERGGQMWEEAVGTKSSQSTVLRGGEIVWSQESEDRSLEESGANQLEYGTPSCRNRACKVTGV